MSLSITTARLRAFLGAIEKPAGEHGCWLWTGAKNCDGYASGANDDPVHRVAYEWMVGPIPDGLELDHLCRVRACVNPHHLEPVTHAENMRRSRCAGPFQLRPYCRRGHALIGRNRRFWSNGPGKPLKVYCYLCHDGERKELRHAS